MIERSSSPESLNSLFAQLNPLDVEQFYTAYQLWSVQQRIQTQQALIDAIQRDIAENAVYLEQTHPSALALATLAHLQTKGVSDITILDRMLERGEEWLDRTMQRLDYCETIDVISGDYTKWCENALEGAYDWIDSMTGQESFQTAPTDTLSSTEAGNGAIELVTSEETSIDSTDSTPSDENIAELFLQKLMSDDIETGENAANRANTENTEIVENKAVVAEDETSMLETTLKIRALSPLPEETVLPETHAELPTVQETRPEAVEPTPVLEETQTIQVEETLLVVEEPVEQEQQPPLLDEEARTEEIAQSAPEMEVQEATPLNTPPTESMVEQEVDTPVANTPVETSEDNVRQEIAPSSPEKGKPKRGFWRTLIAVLFHI